MINKERLLNTFLDYVRIDSESTHEGAMAQRLMEDLQVLGCQIDTDNSQSKTGSDTGNLYVTLPGNTEGEPIILCAHMDTVVPGIGVEPIIEDGIIRSKGDTVLGGDDKSGIAAIVETLRTVVEKDLPHPTIQAVFTVCEEIGLLGSSHLDYSKLQGKRAAVLDSSGDAGKIIIAAPGQYKLNAEVIGRRAHAGVAPEQGISAIQVLAQAISNMKLLRIDEETTANIGTISSEYATNIVPERAKIVAEARSRNNEKLEQQAQHMMDCLKDACQTYGATLEGGLTKAYSAYSFQEDHPLVQHMISACHKAGLQPVLGASGGGSDANNMNHNGIQSVVLGTGMTKVHTTNEELSIANLENIAALTLALATC